MTDNLGDRIVYARDLEEHFDTRGQHSRAAAKGREHRVARGAYMDRAIWEALDARNRYLARIHAVAETRRAQPVISHWSAAAIHDLPVVGAWPKLVHVIVPPTTGGRSRNGVVKHALRLQDIDIVEIDGMLVTSLPRTIVDVAGSSSPFSAISMIDRALHIDRHGKHPPLVQRHKLLATRESMLPFRGHARSLDLIEFAETAAGSPLESASRYSMRTIGCPRPRLQMSFFDDDGFIGDTDFDWPDFGHIGEADGAQKYFDPEYMAGRSPKQVLLDEKNREDRLRAVSRGFTRWGWATATNPRALRQLLLTAGLPMGVPWA